MSGGWMGRPRKRSPRAEKPKFQPNTLGRALQALIETGEWNLTDIGRDGRWAQLVAVSPPSGRASRIRVEELEDDPE